MIPRKRDFRAVISPDFPVPLNPLGRAAISPLNISDM
jgi:hypothetical protein